MMYYLMGYELNMKKNDVDIQFEVGFGLNY